MSHYVLFFALPVDESTLLGLPISMNGKKHLFSGFVHRVFRTIKTGALSTIFLLTVALSSFAQEIPAKYGVVPPEDLAMKQYEPDTAAAAVVLLHYGEMRFPMYADAYLFKLKFHKRIKILKRAAFGEGNMIIPYSKESMKIKRLEAQVIAPDGRVTELSDKDFFKEKVFDGSWAIRFAFPNLQEGSIIEYQYEVECESPSNFYKWTFQEDIPVRWSGFYFEIPVEYNHLVAVHGDGVTVKKYNNRQRLLTEAQISQPESAHDYPAFIQYVAQNKPAVKPESFVFCLEDYYCKLYVQITGFDLKQALLGPERQWEYTAKKLLLSNSLGNQLTESKHTELAWSEARTHLSDTMTPRQKTKALYNWANEYFNIEAGVTFTGVGSYDHLYEAKSATVSELNLLLTVLLRRAGIPATPVVICTRDRGVPVTNIPIYSKLNHLLTRVELPGDTFLLDTGNKWRPMGMIAENHLTDKGWLFDTARPIWIDIQPVPQQVTVFSEYNMDAEGNIQGLRTRRVGGYQAVYQKEAFSKDASFNSMQAALSEVWPNALLDSFSLSGLEDAEAPLLVVQKLALDNMAQVSGDYLYLSPMLLADEMDNPFKTEQRYLPVQFPYPQKLRSVNKFSLPEGYIIESIPESVKLNLPDNAGSFTYQVQKEDNKLYVSYSFQLHKTLFFPDEYDILRSFYGMMSEKLGEQIVIKKTTDNK